MTPHLRDMRAVDLVKITKIVLPPFVGWVIMLGDEEIGYGCVVWTPDGRAFLNFDITDKLRKFPVFIHRTARKIIFAAAQVGAVYALEDRNEPTAAGWLKKLGFEFTGEIVGEERIMAWQR